MIEDGYAAMRRDTAPGLPPPRAPVVAVLDTDYILNRVRDGRDLPGWRPFAPTRYAVFAAQHVYDELYAPDAYGHRHKWDKLSEQAATRGEVRPASIFQTAFETHYQPYMRFVRMGDILIDHPLVKSVSQAAGGRGASDAPTAQLAVLLSRAGATVYTHDKHLWRPGAAPMPQDLVLLDDALRSILNGDEIHAAVFGTSIGAVGLVDLIVRRTGAALGAPTWLSRGVAIAAAVAVLRQPSLRRRTGRVGEVVLEVLTEASEQIAVGLGTIEQVAPPLAADDSLHARVAEAFVTLQVAEALSIAEIQGALINLQAPTQWVPTTRELRGFLAAAPCFEEGPRWRYGLGHIYGD